jgi:hypothetical protein
MLFGSLIKLDLARRQDFHNENRACSFHFLYAIYDLSLFLGGSEGSVQQQNGPSFWKQTELLSEYDIIRDIDQRFST